MSPRSAPSDEAGKPEGRSNETLRVVVADDDHDAVLMLSALFQEEGHQTRGVYRGDQVVSTIVEFGADAALVDLMMPGMTGRDVARELRGRYGPATPLLIAVTAWNTSTDKLLARAAGFDEHVGKPYDPDQLLTLVKQRVKERRDQLARNVVSPVPFGGAADTLHSRLLRKLADVLGGTEPVRRALMVPTRDMSRWIAGVEQMPPAIFVKATDLLISSTPSPDVSQPLRPAGEHPIKDKDASG